MGVTDEREPDNKGPNREGFDASVSALHNETSGLSDDYADRFSGVGRVYGYEGLERLARAHACVIGIGGVGTWSAEALVRSGVGEITLIDLDEICITNINRQLHALTSTVGQAKVEAMAQRLLDINPSVIVHAQQQFFTPRTEEDILGPISARSHFDVVIDAIDHTDRKSLLIEACLRRDLPIVTCGAAGGRRTPQLVTHDDLSRSTHDGLLRRVKRALRKSDVLSERHEREAWGVSAVFSTERPIYPDGNGGVCHAAPSREALRLDCAVGFGSLSFITGTFGFVAAGAAIDLIMRGVSSMTQGSSSSPHRLTHASEA